LFLARSPPRSSLFPYTTLFRSQGAVRPGEDPTAGMVIPSLGLQDGDSVVVDSVLALGGQYFVAVAGMVTKPGMYPWREGMTLREDRKSTRLNSSHVSISYAVFC